MTDRTEDGSELLTEFKRLGNGHYMLVLNYGGITFEVKKIRTTRGNQYGELTVWCALSGAQTYNNILSRKELNLDSAKSQSDRAKLLAVKSAAEAIPWERLLEEFLIRVKMAEDEGDPVKRLVDHDLPADDDMFTAANVKLFKQHPIILFGDGGSGKSLTALYLGGILQQRGINVLYVDWEFSPEDHRDRLERLFRSTDTPGWENMYYARCDRPLVREVDRLASAIHRHRIDYVICDSVAFATEGPPESAEAAAAYYRAIRQLGVGSLHVAHVSKGPGSDMKPFGSTFWHNGARATYFVKSSETRSQNTMKIGLFNRKDTKGPRMSAIGFDITFKKDETTFLSSDIATAADLAKELPLWKRVKESCKSGPKTLYELKEEFGKPLDSIQRAIKRSGDTFTTVDGEDGVARVALPDVTH
jgi:energy-coupling factor transporter ATP-binding protein EcfA2